MKNDDGQVPDTFAHEQYLRIKDGDRNVLISGCSHRGIDKIAAYFEPDVLIGGFHRKKTDPEKSGKAAVSRR